MLYNYKSLSISRHRRSQSAQRNSSFLNESNLSKSPQKNLSQTQQVYRTSETKKSQSQFINDSGLMVWNQSASTWRFSTNNYSFAKAERFQSEQKEADERLKRITIPSFLSDKSCSLGKGEKYYFQPYVEKKGREYPAPGHSQKVINMVKILNVSMGSNERFRSPKVRYRASVGSYEVSKSPGKDKKMYALKGRLPYYKNNTYPPPNHYSPKKDLVSPSKFNKITFGKGERFDFKHKKVNKFLDYDVPGPGTYISLSQFDKFKNIIRKHSQQQQIKKCQINNVRGAYSGINFPTQQTLEIARQRLEESFVNLEKDYLNQKD